jgi:predicted TIM-barrel fold metal-dependent hydrolase
MADLIDIHAHFLTRNYLAAMRAAGVDTVDGFPLPDWSEDSALRAMDEWGIKIQILSISAPGIDFISGDAARSLARNINEELAATIARHPGRFGGFGILPLPDIDAALREMTHVLDVLKFDGIGLYTNFGGTYLGDSRFDPLFAELSRRKAVVYVHPVAPPGFDMARLGFPAPTVEYPFDTTRMIMNLVSSGTMRRFPDFRMIVSHGGGTLPFLAPRITRHLTRFAKVSPPFTPDDATAAFKSLYFDVTAVSHSHAIESVLALAPKDRLLYGSDHPFMLAPAISQAIDFLKASPRLDEGTRRAIFRDNALKLFPRLAHS